MIKVIIRDNFQFYKYRSKEKIRRILDGIRYKQLDDLSSTFFHQLVLNYSQSAESSFNNLTKLVKNILKSKKNNDLVIITNKKNYLNFKAASNFLLSNDLLENDRLNFKFIIEEDFTNLNEKTLINIYSHFFLNSKKNHVNNIIFALDGSNLNKLFISKVIEFINKYSKNNNYFSIGKKVLYDFLKNNIVGDKSKKFFYLEHLNMPLKSNEKYSFFNEINLLLLYLKGIDIKQILDGYKNYANKFLNNYYVLKQNKEHNEAMKLALFLYYSQANLNNQNFFVALDKKCHYLNELFANFFIRSEIKNKNVCILDLPKDLTVLENNVKNTDLIFILNLKKENFNFLLLNEKNEKEIDFDYEYNNLNDYINSYKNSLINELSRNNRDGDLIEINIEESNEYELGSLIALFYWTSIFIKFLSQNNKYEKEENEEENIENNQENFLDKNFKETELIFQSLDKINKLNYFDIDALKTNTISNYLIICPVYLKTNIENFVSLRAIFKESKNSILFFDEETSSESLTKNILLLRPSKKENFTYKNLNNNVYITFLTDNDYNDFLALIYNELNQLFITPVHTFNFEKQTLKKINLTQKIALNEDLFFQNNKKIKFTALIKSENNKQKIENLINWKFSSSFLLKGLNFKYIFDNFDLNEYDKGLSLANNFFSKFDLNFFYSIFTTTKYKNINLITNDERLKSFINWIKQLFVNLNKNNSYIINYLEFIESRNKEINIIFNIVDDLENVIDYKEYKNNLYFNFSMQNDMHLSFVIRFFELCAYQILKINKMSIEEITNKLNYDYKYDLNKS
ncbi:hypothetical protein ACLRE7_00095 [Mycoplasmopsis meleagridis]|uniref:hypothetical protein n=1 Tax=Mycoplasmopsis meleagridis TaxID=29561 RepID=UPI003A842AA0